MPEEQRGFDRRLSDLERSYTDLRNAVQRVEIEQTHVREVLDSRFAALSKGQDLLLMKIDQLTKDLLDQLGDPAHSAAGRAMLSLHRELHEKQTALEEKVGLHHARFATLQKQADQLQGALTLARSLGVAAIVTAFGSLAVALIRLAIAP